MIGDRTHRYRCLTCSASIETYIPLDRLPGLLRHPAGGFQHYVGDTTELCGPTVSIDDPWSTRELSGQEDHDVIDGMGMSEEDYRRWKAGEMAPTEVDEA